MGCCGATRNPLEICRRFSIRLRRGWQVILATNNATLTAAQFAEKIGRFGVRLDSQQIVNSAQATAEYLQARHPQGGPVFVIGEQGLVSELAMKGFYPGEEEPLAVVVGLDRTITYEKLRIASQFVRGGVPLLSPPTPIRHTRPQKARRQARERLSRL